jgi:hypothetical protein
MQIPVLLAEDTCLHGRDWIQNQPGGFPLQRGQLIKVKIEPENTKNVRFRDFKHLNCAVKSSVFSILAPIVLFFDIILLLNYFSQCTVSSEY